MAKGTYYITTPIYYPSDRLHIGHTYTTTAADTVARWHRFLGKDVYFLTGSDEHGQKIERVAREKGYEPLAYVGEIVATFKELWKRYEISYDGFIRTTEERHARVVEAIFTRLAERGDIYKDQYEGWYCTPCETFWREAKLADGKCPDCGRDVELLKEESYFFRLSKYADRLLAHIEAHPDFIQPASRRNEMVSFIKSGLEDLCVSRTTFRWGIPVPFDQKHVVYVWIDALTNYLTAIGYLQDEATFRRYWPADVHLVGKDILRFHTIIWPIILMALDLPLPRQVFGHGWLLVEEGKMSKSKGNVVDPNVLADEFGVDAIRYFLLREVAFGQDANYSRRALIERINSDLANDLGNLLHRSLAMIERYFAGVVPEPGPAQALEQELLSLSERTVQAVADHLGKLEFNLALAAIWRLVGRANKYIDETEPWALRRGGNEERLRTVIYHVAEVQRIVALLVAPFLPSTGRKIWEQLGQGEPLESQRIQHTRFGLLRPGTQTKKGEPLFPRIDLAAEDSEEETAPLEAERDAAPVAAGAEPISIEEFARIDLRLARVLAAEPVQGADKLLKLQLELGGAQRQVVAGIARHYRPEDLVGRQVVIVANLKPVRLRGELSEGMILAAVADDGRLSVVTAAEEMPSGSKVR